MIETSYFAGFISFIVFIALFLILLRLPSKVGWFLLEILTGLTVHLTSSIIGLVFIDGFSYWYQASLFAFLWFCFFFVTSIYSASVSIGIISYLYTQPRHSALLQDIYQNCVENVFKQRAEFLFEQQLAKKTEQGFVSTDKGKAYVKQLQRINLLLRMEGQGFYTSTSTLTNQAKKS